MLVDQSIFFSDINHILRVNKCFSTEYWIHDSQLQQQHFKFLYLVEMYMLNQIIEI